MAKNETRHYEPPQLKVLGSVAELTQQINKTFGDADGGILFQGQPTSVL
jgi:hypothetical protein